jgi:hypothetical protein
MKGFEASLKKRRIIIREIISNNKRHIRLNEMDFGDDT